MPSPKHLTDDDEMPPPSILLNLADDKSLRSSPPDYEHTTPSDDMPSPDHLDELSPPDPLVDDKYTTLLPTDDLPHQVS